MKGFKSKPKKGKGAKHSSHVTPNIQVGEKFTGSQTTLKKVLVGLLMIAVVVGGIWYIYDTLSTRNANKKPSAACSQAVITPQTAEDLKSPSPQALKPTVDKIKKRTDYQKDVSCMYVVTKYYIAISDPVNARASYDQLVKLFKSRDAYNPNIREIAGSPDQFKSTIELLEKQQKELSQTSRTVKQ